MQQYTRGGPTDTRYFFRNGVLQSGHAGPSGCCVALPTANSCLMHVSPVWAASVCVAIASCDPACTAAHTQNVATVGQHCSRCPIEKLATSITMQICAAKAVLRELVDVTILQVASLVITDLCAPHPSKTNVVYVPSIKLITSRIAVEAVLFVGLCSASCPIHNPRTKGCKYTSNKEPIIDAKLPQEMTRQI